MFMTMRTLALQIVKDKFLIYPYDIIKGELKIG